MGTSLAVCALEQAGLEAGGHARAADADGGRACSSSRFMSDLLLGAPGDEVGGSG
jgi:hypothetical protein